MMCGGCGNPFLPGDEIRITREILPEPIRTIAATFEGEIQKAISRVLAHRCAEPGCGGLVTVLYLPPRPDCAVRSPAPRPPGFPPSPGAAP